MKLVINTDGGARGNPGPAGIGVVVADELGKTIGLHKQYIGEATNNVAEYKALILALQKAEMGLRAKGEGLSDAELKIQMDSELIVRQMQGRYKIKEPTLKLLAQEALLLIRKFKNVEFSHVPREKNQLADRLVNEAIDSELKIIG